MYVCMYVCVCVHICIHMCSKRSCDARVASPGLALQVVGQVALLRFNTLSYTILYYTILYYTIL